MPINKAFLGQFRLTSLSRVIFLVAFLDKLSVDKALTFFCVRMKILPMALKCPLSFHGCRVLFEQI